MTKLLTQQARDKNCQIPGSITTGHTAVSIRLYFRNMVAIFIKIQTHAPHENLFSKSSLLVYMRFVLEDWLSFTSTQAEF
jgi:hypothetical protein